MDLIEVDFCRDEYGRFVRVDIYKTEDGEELGKITILKEILPLRLTHLI